VRNIRLTLAYDGTNYVGWQVQPNGLSVQAVVETAIRKLTGQRVKILAAGRTDSGVHALGQVANFKTACSIPDEKMRSGLQNFLPRDIIVCHVEEADPQFHATFSAKTKHYRYVIDNSQIRHPFVSRYTWQYAASLDAVAMHEASQVLLGRHDFRCFESQFPNKATSVRTIFQAAVQRCFGWSVWSQAGWPRGPEQNLTVPASLPPKPDESQPECICFDVVADGFLYNMVRAIVGTLIKVGRHQWSADDVRRIIENQDRSQAGETAPARGLFLVSVNYDDAEPSTPDI